MDPFPQSGTSVGFLCSCIGQFYVKRALTEALSPAAPTEDSGSCEGAHVPTKDPSNNSLTRSYYLIHSRE